MTSMFDMNQPKRICPICTELHAQTTPCKYDSLVRIIHTFKANLMSLLKANREAVDTAKAFQSIINDSVPEMERLVAVEKEYYALVNGLRNSKVRPLVAGDGVVGIVGVNIDDINALLPPDIDDKEDFKRWLFKRHIIEDVKNEVP